MFFLLAILIRLGLALGAGFLIWLGLIASASPGLASVILLLLAIGFVLASQFTA